MKKEKRKSGLSDDRFAHVKSDPKFSGLSNQSKRVVIDQRFAAALTDEKFSARAKVDKRGRKMKKTTGNDLLDLYEVEGEGGITPSKKSKLTEDDFNADIPEVSSSDDENGDDSGDDVPVKVDLARGEGNISSSDDESDSDDEGVDGIQIDMDLNDLDNDADRVEWASRRLAACNLDWDLIHADDLYILVSSFKPTGGQVESVAIYISDFGRERLEEEEKHGPRLELPKPIDTYEEEDSKIDPETMGAMRKYHFDRLKYYYAVIECDSEQTASAIYEQCDGFHFEDSGLKMDLRFIPDDMEFEADRLKEQVSKDDVNVAKYMSKDNVKSAVVTTGSKLGWDEDDVIRKRSLKDAFSDDLGDRTDLIANSDSEDDEETRAHRKNALLSLLSGENEDDGLKVEWDNPEAASDNESDDEDIEKALAKRAAEEEGSEDDDVEENKGVNATQEVEKKNKTTYKDYLQKRKEKRKEKKAQLRAQREGDMESMAEAEQKAKKKQKAERNKRNLQIADASTAEAVAQDDRFKALFTDSAFAIDQSSNLYKGSKLIEKQAAARKEVRETEKKGEDLISKLKGKSKNWNKK